METQNIPPQPDFSPKPRSKGKVVLIILITAVVVGGAVYFIAPQLFKTETQGPAPSLKAPTQQPAEEVTESVEEQFQRAINSKDYTKIEELMTPEVTVIIEATECCGVISRQEAAQQLSYLENAASFNFSQHQQIVQKLKVNLPQYFANEVVGVGTDGSLVSFHVTTEGKVDKVYMAATVDLLDIE